MARWRALLTGYRECVLEASVHSRRLVLVIYTAPDTQQAHDEVSSTSIYLSINDRPAFDGFQPATEKTVRLSRVIKIWPKPLPNQDLVAFTRPSSKPWWVGVSR